MHPWLIAIPPILFMAMVGACMGSFLNVVAFRLPRGEGLFRPGSRCPTCDTPLTWRENFPIFGWLWLRGRCRFCKSPVSGEYPMVEAGCSLVFAGLFVAWYLPSMTGVSATSAAAPEWARAGLLATWPMFMLVLTLIGALVGMTLIDAKTFTIPLSIPTIVTCLALLTHPLHGLAAGMSRGALTPTPAPGWVWTIPTPMHACWVLGGLGAGLGLAVSIGLLWLGVMPRSFADFSAWEAKALAAPTSGVAAAAPAAPTLRGTLVRVAAFTGPAIALMVVGVLVGMQFHEPTMGMGIGMALGLVIGTGLRAMIPERKSQPVEEAPAAAQDVSAVEVGSGVEHATPERRGVAQEGREGRKSRALAGAVIVLVGAVLGALLDRAVAAVGAGVGLLVAVVALGEPAAAAGSGDQATEAPHWLEYPHARREMFKEILFGLPVIGLALLGAWLGTSGPGASWECAVNPPLWLSALTGSILGVIVGGGAIWAVRVMGTLALGKEAMGIGDVHLMAAVGAVLGWIDPLLAFLIAPMFGLGYALLGLVMRGRGAVALPYGPHLALATVAVVVWKPWFEAGLTWLSGARVNLP